MIVECRVAFATVIRGIYVRQTNYIIYVVGLIIKCIILDTSRAKESGEIDGCDYHFISRTIFESEATSGKFLEHGEYDKQYYGTSLDR